MNLIRGKNETIYLKHIEEIISNKKLEQKC